MIKAMREANGLTQAELAKKIGVNQTAISQWEHGTAKPRSDKLPVLAKILKCSIDDLFQDTA